MSGINEIVNNIKKSTGIDLSIYDYQGNIIYSTIEPAYEFILPIGNFQSYQDKNLTVFKIRIFKDLVGVISGIDEVSRNYAIMIAKILENTIMTMSNDIDHEEKLRMLLLGGLNSIQQNIIKSTFPDNINYLMLSLITNNKTKRNELRNFLKTFAAQSDILININDTTIAYFRDLNIPNEYQSPTDFANILYENIKEELRIELVISIGGNITNFDEFISSYDKATFTYKYGKIISPNSVIYSFRDYILVRLLSEIPKSVLNRYLDLLADKNGYSVLSDPDLMNTADEFMKNSLNISETSRNMYMHRNTLIYRIDKIEKETGLNLRLFTDAVTFRLLIILSKLITEN